MAANSIVTTRIHKTISPRRIEYVPLRAFAAKPQRASVLTKTFRRGRVDAFGHIDGLCSVLRAQSGENTLGCERAFAQTNASRIVDGIVDRRNRRGQRSFTALFGPERPLRIDALHDNRINFR